MGKYLNFLFSSHIIKHPFLIIAFIHLIIVGSHTGQIVKRNRYLNKKKTLLLFILYYCVLSRCIRNNSENGHNSKSIINHKEKHRSERFWWNCRRVFLGGRFRVRNRDQYYRPYTPRQILIFSLKISIFFLSR